MPSELEQLKETIDGLARTFESFKTINDTNIKEVKSLGKSTGETAASLDKVQKALDAAMDVKAKADTAVEENRVLKSRIETLEVVLKRGGGFGKKAEDGSELSAEQVEHKGCMVSYLRKGDPRLLNDFKEKVQKSMSIISDKDGGYLVTPDLNGRLVKRMYETSPMRQLASQVSISTDALEGIYDIDQAGAGWVAETAARPATDTPQIGKWRIAVHEMYAKPQISQQLLEDANINVEGWVGEKVADRFARLENTAFVAGDGNGKPTGVLTYANGTTWGTLQNFAATATFTPDQLMAIVYGLTEWYRPGAVWTMTRTSQGIVRTLKDGENRYMWQPGLEAGQPGLLLGYPVREFADMQEVAAGNGACIATFGNYKEGYQIVDRIGVSILRDPFSSKPMVEFYARKRVGGGVVNFDAIKRLVRTS